MQVAMTIKGQSLTLNFDELENVIEAIKYASRNDLDKGAQQFGAVRVESVRFGAAGATTMTDRSKQMFNGRLETVNAAGQVLADF